MWAGAFDGTTVNAANWDFDTGNSGGWGNREWENYQKATAAVGGGALAITARKEYLNGSWQYTSARMKTRKLQDFRFGKVAARIKMPLGRGLWPGFWMKGSNETAAQTWPRCGEIDIMEHVNAGGRELGRGRHTGAALDVSARRPGLYALRVAAADQPVLVRRFCKQ